VAPSLPRLGSGSLDLLDPLVSIGIA
jgi:hypothetical protein